MTMAGFNSNGQASLFDVARTAMSAQLVRMNAAASNLANAGGTTGSADTAAARAQFRARSFIASVSMHTTVTATMKPASAATNGSSSANSTVA